MLRAREAFLRERTEEVRWEQLDGLREERGRLVRVEGSRPQEVAALDRKIEVLEAGIGAAEPRKGRAPTDTLISSLERSLEGIEAMHTDIQKRLELDLVSSHQSEIDRLTESNLRNNLERQRTLFDSVAAQLKQAQIVSDYGSVTAQTINPPKVTPIRPWVIPVLILALALGSGLGTGAALLVDMFEARIRTIADVQTILNVPVITLIPRLLPDQLPGVSEYGLLGQQAPRSLTAELYKSARTHLELVRRHRQAQILMITSPNPGDGKSVTSSNLAISQANAGRKTLLIDADLRCPRIHSIYKLKRDPGLSRILLGEMSVEQVVQSTGIPNLDVISSGDNVPNPSELLSSPSLKQFLDQAGPPTTSSSSTPRRSWQ